jgi:DNA topoisomerase VI subunit B
LPSLFFSSSYKIDQLLDMIGVFVTITSINVSFEGSGNEIISEVASSVFLQT